MKKILLLFSVAIIFFYPIQSTYVEQKVHAVVAGKVVNVGAKKAAKQVIKEITWNMATDMVIDYKYTPKETDPKPKPGFELICFPTDRNSDGHCGRPIEIKKNLTQADKQAMSSKIETVLEKKITNGAGMSKWAKLLDWIVPVSTAAMGITLLDYAINSDVASLFDEIAFETLQESGLVGLPPDENGLETEFQNGNINYSASISSSEVRVTMSVIDGKLNVLRNGTPYISDGTTWTFSVTRSSIAGVKRDEPLSSEDFKKVSAGGLGYGLSQARSVGYTWNTTNDILPADIPTFDEAGIGSNFVPKQPIKIINPNALPMKETTTGAPVKPQKQEDGSTVYIKETPTGPVIVPEDDITVEDAIITEGEPIVVENPDGTTTTKPGPSTVTNPNLPPGEEPNVTLPPIGTPPETPPTFPEGEGCEESLKLPKIGPLFNQLSTSFPFSIPWDLKSGFDAIFEKMGTKKPEFDYEINFNGKTYDFSFTLPSFFDSYMPFVHTMLLFIFDVGILYAIYRLIQGGGSG